MRTITTTTATTITIMAIITMTERPLNRSSPRKRGPRVAGPDFGTLDPRLRGDERRNDEPLSAAALYRLTTWLSPAYPVGGFAYSGGIEWAVEAGDITNPETLRGWLETVLEHGSGLNDAILFAQAYRAVADNDDAKLADIAELAAAFVPTRERQLETTTLGRAFVDVTCAAWPCEALTRLQDIAKGPVAYPVAVGVACAGHDIPLEPALHTFLTALTSSWISAAVRLVPLGHTDSQHTLRAVEPAVARGTQRALAAVLDDLGSATFRADIASARHETQYTRLFRS